MPSRRNNIELTDAEIRAFLDSSKTLIIVSNGKDGYPHPMPMWFYVDDAGLSLLHDVRQVAEGSELAPRPESDAARRKWHSNTHNSKAS